MDTQDWTVALPEQGARLDKWLAAPGRLRSRARAREALLRGRIFLDEVEQGVADGSRAIEAGMAIRYWADRPGSATRRGPSRVGGLDIVYEDDALVVVAKEPGIPAVPVPDDDTATSLQDRLREHWRSHRQREPLVVHRIDRDTSGLVVFARTSAAWTDLKRQFEARSPQRRYLAIVFGVPTPGTGVWQDRLAWSEARRMQRLAAPGDEDVREAITRYRVIESFAEASLVEFDLGTGRQHQIRMQAMLHGHPLFGERLYVGRQGLKAKAAHRRQALHAAHLAFDHPSTGRPVAFEAPLPKDLLGRLARLRRARP
jgi:23S rRNA pseudouridine1911/1915/1917 synthase